MNIKKQIIIKENKEKLVSIFWDGREEQINYDIFLETAGAELKLLGLLLGEGENKLQININVIHAAPNTKSEVVFKGVLRDRSKIDFKGLIKIEKGAKGTDTWLAAHLLILSDQAKGKVTPSLEILENDIKAGHVATVGKVSDMEMFYLQSRGLSKTQAKNLIVQGFLSSVLQRLPKNLQKKAEEAHL